MFERELREWKNVMAHMCEREGAKPKCVVGSLRAARRRG